MQTQIHIDSAHRKILIFLNITSLLLFLSILYCVVIDSYIVVIDRWVNIHVISIQTPTLTNTLAFITNLYGVLGNVVFALFALFFLSYKKWYVARRFYLVSFLGASVLFSVIKQLVARPRPHSDLIDVINYSFPSGHATMSMTTALILYFIVAKRYPSSWVKYLFLFFGVGTAMFIAFTRVYLNVHWFSDVLAGLTLGVFWVTLMRLYVYEK